MLALSLCLGGISNPVFLASYLSDPSICSAALIRYIAGLMNFEDYNFYFTKQFDEL